MSAADRLARAVRALLAPAPVAIVPVADAKSAKKDTTGSMPGLWGNVYTGLGGADRDRTAWHVPGGGVAIDSETLSTLWEDDPIAGAVIDAPVDDAMRSGIVIAYHGTEDSDKERVPEAQKLADQVRFSDRVRLGSKMGRAFGGAGLVMLANDGRLSASTPLDPERVTSIERLIAQDARRLTVYEWDLDEHESYMWSPAATGFERYAAQRLHASHVIVFEGLDTSLDSRQRRWGGWWKPVLQHVWEAIRDYRQSWQSTVAMLQDGSQGVLSLPGLADAITRKGYGILETTLQRIQMYRWSGRIMPIDGGGPGNSPPEKFEWVERSFAGIADLLQAHKDIVCQASGIPAPRLYGNYSTSGLNDSGAGAAKDWNNKVDVWRRTKIEPPATRLAQLLARTLDVSDPDHWGIDWPGLEVRTDSEQAALEKTVAEVDDLRIGQGVPPEAIVRTRYFGPYTTAAPQLTDEERTAFEVQAALAAEAATEPAPEPAEAEAEATDPEEAAEAGELEGESDAIETLVRALQDAIRTDPDVTAVPTESQRGKRIVQSVLLPGSWSEREAKAWCKEHGYRTVAIEKAGKHWRFRQFNPSHFVAGTFRMQEAGEALLVIGKVAGE